MAIFKKKVTQLELASAVMEFIRRARFRDIAYLVLPKSIPKAILDRFVRAELYLVLVSTINFYPDKPVILASLIHFIYEELYSGEFQSYEEFRTFFDEDFKEFERMLHFGEKTGNGMLFGISMWVYDEPKGNLDLIGQMEITPHLFTVYDQIRNTHEKSQAKFKVID